MSRCLIENAQLQALQQAKEDLLGVVEVYFSTPTDDLVSCIIFSDEMQYAQGTLVDYESGELLSSCGIDATSMVDAMSKLGPDLKDVTAELKCVGVMPGHRKDRYLLFVGEGVDEKEAITSLFLNMDEAATKGARFMTTTHVLIKHKMCDGDKFCHWQTTKRISVTDACADVWDMLLAISMEANK